MQTRISAAISFFMREHMISIVNSNFLNLSSSQDMRGKVRAHSYRLFRNPLLFALYFGQIVNWVKKK